MKNIKIKSVTNEYGIVDAKGIKSFLKVYGLDREKLQAAIKRLDLSQKMVVMTSMGNITVRMDYDIKNIEIIASPKIREEFAKIKES